MRRRYERELYAERVAKIKSLMPHACIGVDVIVGFPSETEEDFRETYDFLHGLDISYLHVFTYSERPDTTALRIKGRVPNAIRSERNTMLSNLSHKKRRAFYESQLNSTHEVLWESENHDGFMHGFTENYVKVKSAFNASALNSIYQVKLDYIDDDGIVMLK
jgi:threonylcarbamoyladenosine tRNA methylthiotransferase MtaB